MKVTVETTEIATVREWTMKITGKHENNPEWIAVVKAESSEDKNLKTRWSVTIYTNTKGVSTRKWTRGETDERDSVANSTAMSKLAKARELLKEKAKEQAEYMAQNESISDDKRIESKTNETIISLRYIDDE